ncbi:hypothetical protein BIW11_13758 [Tropilaelaps mercedesae]|uniref:Uncharacterized protein n=1 Tax=Tropilaelaps mercedesae TaxID=418985 RepID=A0A1V9X0M5_9ACAR|nr:hypothetical protein BIW11_13758 [Tropilaelaps mercedesae]
MARRLRRWPGVGKQRSLARRYREGYLGKVRQATRPIHSYCQTASFNLRGEACQNDIVFAKPVITLNHAPVIGHIGVRYGGGWW